MRPALCKMVLLFFSFFFYSFQLLSHSILFYSILFYFIILKYSQIAWHEDRPRRNMRTTCFARERELLSPSTGIRHLILTIRRTLNEIGLKLF
jgi:hypothetical protein